MDDHKGDSIPTNLRLLLVLEEITKLGVPVTPTDINQYLGLPKPTIHRLFSTLEEEGFLQRELDGRSYSPGWRLRQLATGTLSSLRVRTARLAVMHALAREIGETCNLAIADREAMLYLDRVETKWPLRIQLPVGTHVPFHCTASGKLYLSSLNPAHLERFLRNDALERKTYNTITTADGLRTELTRIREAGYSHDNEEFLEGMIAFAVPVLDRHGRLASTLAFHAPTQRMSLDEGRRHLPRLRAAASELTRLIAEDARDGGSSEAA